MEVNLATVTRSISEKAYNTNQLTNLMRIYCIPAVEQTHGKLYHILIHT